MEENSMNYKCKICGWKKEQGSTYWTTEDYKEVFKHEESHSRLAKLFKRKD
tara:strand:- start:480 stop:632 length:153 start_codon:yes stop_codon:yes gene_type:complete